jgi:hypothetical protein
MIRLILAPICLGFLGLAIIPPPARAQLPWDQFGLSTHQQAALVWRYMDLCAQQAAKQFQDHTPDGNAKREAARLECLRRNHLPVDPKPPEHH